MAAKTFDKWFGDSYDEYVEPGTFTIQDLSNAWDAAMKAAEEKFISTHKQSKPQGG
jgi:hypothetical protein